MVFMKVKVTHSPAAEIQENIIAYLKQKIFNNLIQQTFINIWNIFFIIKIFWRKFHRFKEGWT